MSLKEDIEWKPFVEKRGDTVVFFDRMTGDFIMSGETVRVKQ